MSDWLELKVQDIKYPTVKPPQTIQECVLKAYPLFTSESVEVFLQALSDAGLEIKEKV